MDQTDLPFPGGAGQRGRQFGIDAHGGRFILFAAIDVAHGDAVDDDVGPGTIGWLQPASALPQQVVLPVSAVRQPGSGLDVQFGTRRRQ